MAKKSIKNNFIYQMIYEIFALILPLITSPYISRVIGAEGLGIYSYTFSIAHYFVLFSLLGIKNYGNRLIAQCRDQSEELNRQFSSLLLVHIAVSMIISVIYFVYACFISGYRLFSLIQGFFVLSALFDISWFYFGIEEFKVTVIRDIFIKVSTVILVFTLVRTREDLWKYCGIMASGMLISQMMLWIPIRKYVKFIFPDKEAILQHIRPLVILFIPAIAISLYKYMDKIMIGSMSNKTELGYYENAEKVVSIPLTIISAFGTVMLPKMSNLISKADMNNVRRYIYDSMRYVMCLAFALACGMAGVGKVFAPVFWGYEFDASGILIQGLSVTMPFIAFANVIRTQYLIPTEKDREYLISVLTGAIVNLLINWLLIPRYGAWGATIGTIAAEAMVCMVQVYAVRKELEIGVYIKNSIPFMAIGLIMFGCVYYYGNLHGTSIMTLLVQIMIGIIIYVVCTFAYLYAIREKMLMNTIQRISRRLR